MWLSWMSFRETLRIASAILEAFARLSLGKWTGDGSEQEILSVGGSTGTQHLCVPKIMHPVEIIDNCQAPVHDDFPRYESHSV